MQQSHHNITLLQNDRKAQTLRQQDWQFLSVMEPSFSSEMASSEKVPLQNEVKGGLCGSYVSSLTGSKPWPNHQRHLGLVTQNRMKLCPGRNQVLCGEFKSELGLGLSLICVFEPGPKCLITQMNGSRRTGRRLS